MELGEFLNFIWTWSIFGLYWLVGLTTQALLEKSIRRRIRFKTRGAVPEKRILHDVTGGLVGGIDQRRHRSSKCCSFGVYRRSSTGSRLKCLMNEPVPISGGR